MRKDSLGDRMKTYEAVSKTRLVNRMPVIMRIDGKAFHTLTRGFNKPFDEDLSQCMEATMKKLCASIQGCVFGYTQSDEITLILQDYKTLSTSAWFDNEVQKMCSVAASIATVTFNNAMLETISKVNEEKAALLSKRVMQAMFDCRVFNVPKEDVCNNLIWRQQDATRNSIEALGRAHFSDKELYKKSCSMIQDMLMTEKGINWNDTPTKFKRGLCCIKDDTGHWKTDYEIPIFTQNREYVERHFIFEEDKKC